MGPEEVAESQPLADLSGVGGRKGLSDAGQRVLPW